MRYIRWTGELRLGGVAAIERLRERRIGVHICAPMTLHLNKRKACALGDEHLGCCPGTCKQLAQLALGV